MQHDNYNGKKIYSRPIDYINSYSNSDHSKMCFYEVIRVIYQFISPDLKKKINYLPQDLNLLNLDTLKFHLLNNLKKLAKTLNLNLYNKLEKIVANIISVALERGFCFKDVPSNDLPSLALAFLFLALQISDEHKEMSRNSLIMDLNRRGYSFSEHSLGPILEYINKYITEDIDFNFKSKINSDYFRNELEAISSEHRSFGRKTASIFVDLILNLYVNSNFEPQEFARKLKIYSSEPSLILIRIREPRVLTRVDVFIGMKKKIIQFM